MDYNKKLYRLAIVALLLIFAGLQYRLWIGKGSLAQVHQLNVMNAELKQENGVAHKRNQAMMARISDLKTGESAAKGRARSQLGMIKPGEVFFLTPQDESPSEIKPTGKKDGADD